MKDRRSARRARSRFRSPMSSAWRSPTRPRGSPPRTRDRCIAAALQNAWVLGAFALVFVALALSMFGLYELRLPGFLHQRLDEAHRRLPGGRVASVAGMGALSAVIVSPCVAAPLAGALLYIAQTRDVALGGAALFAMALGMGVPLLVMGISEGALLPKSGPWLNRVKQFFGVLLLAVAAWIVSPLFLSAKGDTKWRARRNQRRARREARRPGQAGDARLLCGLVRVMQGNGSLHLQRCAGEEAARRHASPSSGRHCQHRRAQGAAEALLTSSALRESSSSIPRGARSRGCA